MFYIVDFETEISDGIIQYYCEKNNIKWKYSGKKLMLELPDDKTYRDNMIDDMLYILKSYLNQGFFSVPKDKIDKINEIILLWDGEIIWKNSPDFVVGKIKMCRNIANMKCYFMTNSDKWINKTITDIENDKLPMVCLKNDYPNFENIFVKYSSFHYNQVFSIKKISDNSNDHSETYLVELIGLHDIYKIYEKYSKYKVSINFSNEPYLISESLVRNDKYIDYESEMDKYVSEIFEQYEYVDESKLPYLILKTQYEKDDNCDLIWCKSIQKYFNSRSVF